MRSRLTFGTSIRWPTKSWPVLKYPVLSRMLREYGHSEMYKFRWDDAAVKVKRVYEEVLTEPAFMLGYGDS